MMFSQEAIVHEGVKFADQHGVIAFLLVAVLIFGGWLGYKVLGVASTLSAKWLDANIEATRKNTKLLEDQVKAQERNADALELIGAAVTATEKANELVIAKIDGVDGNVKRIQSELVEVKQEIRGMQKRLDL